MRRILVTGSRDWTDRAAVWRALWSAAREGGSEPVTVVHGDCPTGADRYAKEWCHEVIRAGLPCTEEPHPADWSRHGKAAGPIRNQEMVDLGAVVCLSFPLKGSRGTVDCTTRATAAEIPVVSHEP